MAAAGGEAAQKALQAVAQATGWTYTVLWRLCPRQGALVWAEGHYNGAIRTRKTVVQPGPAGEDAEEEDTAAGAARAALRRSRQLRELYDSLAAVAGEAADGACGGGGGGGASREDGAAHVVVPRRRPTAAAALAPEDLTETEWFYLMCASYCFPPAVGLPGEAFARRGHVWLCGANKVDSKVFSRAILARSAGIQTVACIPVDDGVLEIGTTEKVEEDIGLIQYARSIFMDQHGAHVTPTLSGHSTSTPATTHINPQPSWTKMENDIHVQQNSLYHSGDKQNDEMEDDDDRIDFETNTENDPSPRHNNLGNEHKTLNAGTSEMMLIGTSERIRDGYSNQMDEEIPMFRVCQEIIPEASEDQAVLVAENAHYIQTVLKIIRSNARRQMQGASNIRTYLALSKNSSFSRWNWNHKGSSYDLEGMLIPEGTPQRMLKSILLGGSSTSSHHWSYKGEGQSAEPRDDGEGTSRSRRGTVVHAELSASHVVKERRRREKLNERFITLRSLVPFVTKMDRASILSDTIEYVKQLRRRIQELESRARLVESRPTTAMAPPPGASTQKQGARATGAAEASGSCGNSSIGIGAEVQVSIIESDALVELRCPHREGLLLRVMQALHRELRMEVTSVQASSAGDVLLAEFRAKLKEVHGRRSSITEVKRVIHLIVSSD